MVSSCLKNVISASRRTDIPAFYMEWFYRCIQEKQFELINPYNGMRRLIAADSDHVGAIFFWSKNFGPFIRGKYGRELARLGYQLIFNFTINSESPIIEPHLPDLEERLQQFSELARSYPLSHIRWRFDPVCFFLDSGGILRNNLSDLNRIAKHLSRVGIRQCTTSFVDLYPKVIRRANAKGIRFVDADPEFKIETLLSMEQLLSAYDIELSVCCEKELVKMIPEKSSVMEGACLSHDCIKGDIASVLSHKADRGQRRSAGCLCHESFDVGNYGQHPCYHNCLFCYANPKAMKGGK